MAKFLLLVTLGTALAMPVVTYAQVYPSRPIRLIVSSAPGGNPDINSRNLASELTKQLG